MQSLGRVENLPHPLTSGRYASRMEPDEAFGKSSRLQHWLIAIIITVSLVAGIATLLSAIHPSDLTAPSTYADAVAAMKTLPNVRCDAVGDDSTTCSWRGWHLDMKPSTGSVADFCTERQKHVVFGGDAWTLVLTPEQGASPPPVTGTTSLLYVNLTDAFNFGNGPNWMAC
jgi:hypothetical protein